MLEVSNREYKVKGYYGKWSVIDTYEDWALLEHCTCGDETCYLVVRRDVKVQRKYSEDVLLNGRVEGYKDIITEVVCETYDDIVTALEDECLID